MAARLNDLELEFLREHPLLPVAHFPLQRRQDLQPAGPVNDGDGKLPSRDERLHQDGLLEP